MPYDFTFTIKRSEWARGNINRPGDEYGQIQTNRLFNKEINTFCCLGIFGRECGVSPEVMANEAEPDDIIKDAKIDLKTIPTIYQKKLLDFSLFDEEEENYEEITCSNLSSECMSINDDTSLTEEEREFKLKKEFNKHGVQVIFVD